MRRSEPHFGLGLCLPQRLSEIKGLSEAKVEKMLEAAKKSCSGFGIQTAKDYEAQVLWLAKCHVCATACAPMRTHSNIIKGCPSLPLVRLAGGAGSIAPA